MCLCWLCCRYESVRSKEDISWNFSYTADRLP